MCDAVRAALSGVSAAVLLPGGPGHAVVWPEVEAKISDQPWPGLGTKVDPHHLTTAKAEMVRAGLLTSTTAATRGGRRVSVWHRPVERGAARAVTDASARKRLLHARCQRAEQHDGRPVGVVAGAAGLRGDVGNGAGVRGEVVGALVLPECVEQAVTVREPLDRAGGGQEQRGAEQFLSLI